jgi:hypothetical protein
MQWRRASSSISGMAGDSGGVPVRTSGGGDCGILECSACRTFCMASEWTFAGITFLARTCCLAPMRRRLLRQPSLMRSGATATSEGRMLIVGRCLLNVHKRKHTHTGLSRLVCISIQVLPLPALAAWGVARTQTVGQMRAHHGLRPSI